MSATIAAAHSTAVISEIQARVCSQVEGIGSAPVRSVQNPEPGGFAGVVREQVTE